MVVGLGLTDIIAHSFSNVLLNKMLALVACNFSPRGLRIDSDALRYIISKQPVVQAPKAKSTR